MSKIKSFKQYLSKHNPVIGKLYFGPINHDFDQGFQSALKAAETKVSKAIDRSIHGLLLKSDGSFNTNADINDFVNSINLISNAQATVETLDAQKDQEIPPETDPRNVPPDYEQVVDPVDSQQIGLSQQIIPEDIIETNQDNRYLSMLNMLKNQ